MFSSLTLEILSKAALKSMKAACIVDSSQSDLYFVCQSDLSIDLGNGLQ